MIEAPLYCDFCRGSPILEASENAALELESQEPALAGRKLRFEVHCCTDCRRTLFAPTPSGLRRLQDEIRCARVAGYIVFGLSARPTQRKRR